MATSCAAQDEHPERECLFPRLFGSSRAVCDGNLRAVSAFAADFASVLCCPERQGMHPPAA